MREVFASIVPWATLAFAVSSMLSVGLGNTVAGILGPLRHKPRVVRALAANFILSPALALLVVGALDLDLPNQIGLFLVGTAAGAPFLVSLTRAAGADVPFAGSLLVLLLPLTVAYLPIFLPTVLPAAEVSAVGIAQPLLLSMLLPLGVGLLLRRLAPGPASRTLPLLRRFTTTALVVLLLSILVGDWAALTAVGWRAMLAALAYILGAFALGWSLGGRYRSTRNTVALATAQRNIAAAIVVATQAFAGMPGVVVMVTATSIVGLLVLFPLAFLLRRRAMRPALAAGGRRPARVPG